MSSNWREQKKIELKLALYDAAVRLFENEGYEATTVQQISDEVGVAKGTFFNHFPSKEHVINEWYNRITAKAIANARKRDGLPAKRAIAELFADMSGQAVASPELMIATSRNHSTALLLDASRRQVTAVQQFLSEQCLGAKERGEIAGDTDIEFFVQLLTSVLSGTSRAWALSVERFNFPTLIAERVHFLFKAAETATAAWDEH